MSVFGQIMVVGLGGFVGANLRYWIGVGVGQRAFPVGTLFINVVGCFGLACFSTLMMKSQREDLRLLVAPGFFGAFTTFSTFSYEALMLTQQGRMGAAAAYLSLSLGLGLLAGALGIAAARFFLAA